MRHILYIFICLSVSFATSAQTTKSPTGLLSNHFYESGLVFSQNADTKDWSGGFSQSGRASIHPNINLGLGADFTMSSSQLDAYEFALSPYITAHFLPDGQVDPYVTVGFVYGQSKLLASEIDSRQVYLEVGTEIRISDFVSILPSINYEYGRFDVGPTLSAGYIEPKIGFAFRLGRESRLWLAPHCSYNLKVHGDDALADVLSLGLRFLIQL